MVSPKAAAQNPQPNDIQVEYPDEVVPLPPDAEQLIQLMFTGHARLEIVQELGGGFTQSQVLVVRPWHSDDTADLPLVVKIGPTWLIQQEERSYRRYIRDKLAGRIELVKVEMSDVWGGLGYRLAGDGQFKHESLAHFCRNSDPLTVANLLNGRLFKRLDTIWQSATVAAAPYPAAKYDRLLPVHAVITPGAVPSDVSLRPITPDQ
ncbi:MAG: hypothetical protein KDI02_21385, partial [Anaerolineae bacterium]|nr:hypothetical protein [Anaerolineae bacterium]